MDSNCSFGDASNLRFVFHSSTDEHWCESQQINRYALLCFCRYTFPASLRSSKVRSPCSTCEERQIDVCMNASCAFQHFCDIHGPQILLCTEAKPYAHDDGDTQEDNLNAFYSQYIKSTQPQDKVECKVNACKKERDGHTEGSVFFQSCTISPDGVLLSTVDSFNHMLFITSPSTPNQDLFKDLRNACVRSLNVEVSRWRDSCACLHAEREGLSLKWHLITVNRRRRDADKDELGTKGFARWSSIPSISCFELWFF